MILNERICNVVRINYSNVNVFQELLLEFLSFTCSFLKSLFAEGKRPPGQGVVTNPFYWDSDPVWMAHYLLPKMERLTPKLINLLADRFNSVGCLCGWGSSRTVAWNQFGEIQLVRKIVRHIFRKCSVCSATGWGHSQCLGMRKPVGWRKWSIVALTVKNKYSTKQLSKIFVIASELLIKGILKSLANFFSCQNPTWARLRGWGLLGKWDQKQSKHGE